jgi:hypothetical protein
MNHETIATVFARIESIEISLRDLKSSLSSFINYQSDRIGELESRVDPYSTSGQAICNYYEDMDD